MPSTETDVYQKPESVWSLAEAVQLLNEVLPEAYLQGWYIMLSGGVVFNGYSTSDLDMTAMRRLRIAYHHIPSLVDIFVGLGWKVLSYKSTPFERIKMKKGEKNIDLTFGRWT